MKLEVTEILRNNQWKQWKGIQAAHFVTSLIFEKKKRKIFQKNVEKMLKLTEKGQKFRVQPRQND